MLISYILSVIAAKLYTIVGSDCLPNFVVKSALVRVFISTLR